MLRVSAWCATAFVLVACGGKAIGDDLITSSGGGTSGASGGSGGGSSGSSGSGGSSGSSGTSGGSSGSSGSSGTSGGGSCVGGTLFDYCASDGTIATQCCPANADCAAPESFCKLGGGRCRHGSCTTKCGDSTTCAADALCVVTESGGGPCLQPDDTGLCPDGKPPNGACCNRTTTTYECKSIPTACGADVSCSCAPSLCPCGMCSATQATNTLSCSCLYP